MTVILMEIAALALDSHEQPILFLRPSAGEAVGDRVLPIWIGAPEAAAIMVAMGGDPPPRPMSYDLMNTLVERLDASVRQVAVTRLDSGTFYAEITLDTPAGVQVIDARPSDSVAIAVRSRSPILVSEAVLAEAGLPGEVLGPTGAGPRDGRTEETEHQVEEFNRFLDTVDPDDFRG